MTTRAATTPCTNSWQSAPAAEPGFLFGLVSNRETDTQPIDAEAVPQLGAVHRCDRPGSRYREGRWLCPRCFSLTVVWYVGGNRREVSGIPVGRLCLSNHFPAVSAHTWRAASVAPKMRG